MLIGIPKECKQQEHRVGLMPQHVAQLTKQHTVYVQKNAGLGAGCSNEAYLQAGASLVPSLEAVYENATFIVKVKEPQPEEYSLIKAHHTLFTFFHFAASQTLTQAMLTSRATCIAYETIEDHNGSLPLLAPMSEVAGRLAGQQAAKYLEKPQGGSGILIGGITEVAPANALVLGGGVVGINAAEVLMGMGANVTVFDINESRLEEIAQTYNGKINTSHASKERIEAQLPTADVVIGAVLVKGAKAPKLISKNMLKLLKSRAVLVDVAVDQGGCFETTRPTTHNDPTYLIDDILHYAVANMPGAVPRTSTQGLSNKTFPYLLKLLNTPLKALPVDIRKGINIYNGVVTNKEVADAFKLPYTHLLSVLS